MTDSLVSRLYATASAAQLQRHSGGGQVHIGLAHSYIRAFDKRSDDQIRGTGGTIFTTYLRQHRDATKAHRLRDHQEGDSVEGLV